MGQENTKGGRVWVPASMYGIAGREKGQLGHRARLKAELGGHEVGLPRWPTAPRGERIREFRCPIQESRVGTVMDREN